MTAQPFDWIDDADDIVVRSQNAIAVYFNGQGDVVIRQENAMPEIADDNDVAIVIAPHHVSRLIAALQTMIGETIADVTAPAGQPKKDPTNAERQRRYRAQHRNGRNEKRDAKRNGASDEFFDNRTTDSETDK